MTIPLSEGQPIPSGAIQIPVVAETVEPGKIIFSNKMIRVFFTQTENKISIKTNGFEGNFDITVSVLAYETDPAFIWNAAAERRSFTNAKIEGMHIIFDEEYQKAVNSCWAAFFNNLPSAPLKRKGIKSDFEIAKFLGTRIERSGILRREDIEASRSFIAKISGELPGMAKQLKSAFDVIVHQNQSLKDDSNIL